MAWRSSLSSAVKELRLHLSQTSPGSEGLRLDRQSGRVFLDRVSHLSHARNYIKNNYAALKEANPNLPILVREAQSVEARIFAQYGGGKLLKARCQRDSDSHRSRTKDRGVERKAVVEGFTEEQINATLEQLAKGK